MLSPLSRRNVCLDVFVCVQLYHNTMVKLNTMLKLDGKANVMCEKTLTLADQTGGARDVPPPPPVNYFLFSCSFFGGKVVKIIDWHPVSGKPWIRHFLNWQRTQIMINSLLKER